MTVLHFCFLPECKLSSAYAKDLDNVANAYLHVGVGQDELSHNAVVREAVDAIAHCDHKHSGGGVEAVAGCQEAGTRLAHVQDAVLHSRNALSRNKLNSSEPSEKSDWHIS